MLFDVQDAGVSLEAGKIGDGRHLKIDEEFCDEDGNADMGAFLASKACVMGLRMCVDTRDDALVDTGFAMM